MPATGMTTMSMTRDYVFLGILFGMILAANLTITPERETQVAFSEPYLWGTKEVLVSHKDAGAFKNRDDLAGPGSTCERAPAITPAC
jgi:hypothetical protein